MQVKLGDGKFLVTATMNGIIFKSISCVSETGKNVNMKDFSDDIVDSFTLYFQNYEEIQQLKNLLAKSYENTTFSFKYLDFDTTNYSRKSIDCIIDQLNWIERFMPKCYSV